MIHHSVVHILGSLWYILGTFVVHILCHSVIYIVDNSVVHILGSLRYILGTFVVHILCVPLCDTQSGQLCGTHTGLFCGTFASPPLWCTYRAVL
jgi:hypothetical protein